MPQNKFINDLSDVKRLLEIDPHIFKLFHCNLLHIHCKNYSSVQKECGIFKFKFLMVVVLAFSHLQMPIALTLQDYQYPCLWRVRFMSFG